MKLSEHIAACVKLLAENGDLDIIYLDGADDASTSFAVPELSIQKPADDDSFVMIHGAD